MSAVRDMARFAGGAGAGLAARLGGVVSAVRDMARFAGGAGVGLAARLGES
jgi:hypothetical protein